MRTVFISYSQADLTQVESIVAHLKTSGDIQVWRDRERLYGGQKWPKILGEAIDQQDIFLLFWSKHAADAHFVELEWTTALALKKTIIPYQLDGTPLPRILVAAHALSVGDIGKVLEHIQKTDINLDTAHSTAVLERLAQIKATEVKKIKVAEVKEIIKEVNNIVNFNLSGANFNDSSVYQIAADTVIKDTVININWRETSDLLRAKTRYLIGRVVSIGEYDELTPDIGLEVVIMQSNERTQTEKGGRFQLLLNENLKSGTEISLLVDKADWCIYIPMDGKARVPAELDKELIEIQLLPNGSKKFWSHDRIEKFIQNIAERAKQQVQPEGKPQDIDLSRYIKEWALKYGFSVRQAKAEIDKWAVEIEQQNDPYQLGLAAFARKNFGEASRFFAQSAQQKAQTYEQTLVDAERYRADTVRDYQLAGDVAYSDYQFTASRTHYQTALRYVSRVLQPQLWATIQNAIGIANWQLAVRSEGGDIHVLFKQAAQAYRDALRVYTRESLPQDWAMTQNNLGAVLQAQGIRTEGEAGTELLKQAVQAYRDALTVRTRESLPQDWAMTQNNLGAVLQAQGIRTEGEAGTELLKQAVQAYRDALTVYTRESLPQDWAMTQNNLGAVLQAQGIRTEGEAGTELLKQAVQAYRDVLEVEPDNELVYQVTINLYQDILFSFHDTFTVHQQWLLRHPDNLLVRVGFAEAHFTTSRFAEAEQQLAALLAHADLESGIRVGLQGIRIANLLALHDDIASALLRHEELLTLMDKLPADFEPIWLFSGAKQFVSQAPKLDTQRDVLLNLFTALEEKNSDQRRRALESVVQKLKVMQQNAL